MVDKERVLRMIEGGRGLVPFHMWGAVERYFVHGVSGGSFLDAVLSNDLMEAFARADQVNSENMRKWCEFLYNYAPSGSHGSREAVQNWLASFHAEEADA
jgi:hypothetical protein